MSYQEVFGDHAIAISTSNSPDMPALGLSSEHLKDAAAEIARHLLALGARLYYGGDLRADGFSKLLFELVSRHKRDSDEGDSRQGVTNFLAWPVHIRLPFSDIEETINELAGIAELVCLDVEGRRQSLADRQQLHRREPSEIEWANGLTAMRTLVQSKTRARIVLGGQVNEFKGRMPGIAEEALITLTNHQPIYLLGGFGGCARDISEALHLVEPWLPFSREWPGRSFFDYFGIHDLNNGLTEEENKILARTPHIDQAIVLVLKGLVNLDIDN